jgi:hydrogenase maturation protein HypF
MNSCNAGRYITIRGIVQGVGFRPFVYTLAIRYGLNGWVLNSSNGVEIEVDGAPEILDRFISDLKTKTPPLARIDTFNVANIPVNGYSRFEIRESTNRADEFLPVSPDVAVCPDCRRELFDPADRRYRYPFINCTNCGPRFTIIREIPYDRPNTTMSAFPMCPACREEYENPLNRRFHAQPVACPECGPRVWFEADGKRLAEKEDAVQMTRRWLKDGRIVAVKGLGGYHLACDAANPEAVEKLRDRKKRSQKAFALMAWDVETVRRYCEVSPEESAILSSHQSPIVLLQKKAGVHLPRVIAPGQSTLGLMLPYTPLHLLLLEPQVDYPDVLVMTSGNLSEEPIAYRDSDTGGVLSGLADGFLLHNRDIQTRVDDSVVRMADHRLYPVRRSRGYAPDAVQLPHETVPVLACGAELKNTFCLTRGSYAFISHHIGDLENYETLQSFEEGIRHYEALFRVKPQKLICDLHPNYLSTRYAVERAEAEEIPLIQVQHHHAHLAACLADNGWNKDEPVIGLCMDGTGMGTDGAIWGGEVLVGGYAGYQRRYHFDYLPLPGGDLAIRKPARFALACLYQAGIDWEPVYAPINAFSETEKRVIHSQLDHSIQTFPTSSLGRLFDAVSALAGICQEATYEGQAAIELEEKIDPQETGRYEIPFAEGMIDSNSIIRQAAADVRMGTAASVISARFHNGLVRLFTGICEQIRSDSGIQTVALSGGVWQNSTLLEGTLHALRQSGFTVLIHHQVPANDGGISLGQVMVVANMER